MTKAELEAEIKALKETIKQLEVRLVMLEASKIYPQPYPYPRTYPHYPTYQWSYDTWSTSTNIIVNPSFNPTSSTNEWSKT